MEYHPIESSEKEAKKEMIKGLRIPPEGISMEKVEEALVREALAMTDGNQTKAARLLDISRDSLRHRMHKFGIDRSNSAMSASLQERYSQQSNTTVDRQFDADTGRFLGKLPEQSNNKDRRGFKRKQINCPACVGEDRSKTGEFAMGTILDISVGGIRFAVPRDKKLEIWTDNETAELCISFTLPNNLWPVGVKCRPKRIVESADEVEIGAAFVDTDIRSYHALRQYLN